LNGGVTTGTLILNYTLLFVRLKKNTMKRRTRIKRNALKDEFISFAVALNYMLSEEEGMDYLEYTAFKTWWIEEFKRRFPCFTNRIVLQCWNNFEKDLNIKIKIEK